MSNRCATEPMLADLYDRRPWAGYAKAGFSWTVGNSCRSSFGARDRVRMEKAVGRPSTKGGHKILPAHSGRRIRGMAALHPFRRLSPARLPEADQSYVALKSSGCRRRQWQKTTRHWYHASVCLRGFWASCLETCPLSLRRSVPSEGDRSSDRGRSVLRCLMSL